VSLCIFRAPFEGQLIPGILIRHYHKSAFQPPAIVRPSNLATKAPPLAAPSADEGSHLIPALEVKKVVPFTMSCRGVVRVDKLHLKTTVEY
jgi:hypothetical protein